MSYLHIDNLYKNTEILLFRECYALEKCHGSSAHITWNEGELRFFAGGSKHAHFVSLFNEEDLREAFLKTGQPKIVVHGEGYGGKLQGMKHTYGPNLRFIAFDVKVGDVWLSVPQAEILTKELGLEFVPYVKIPATIEDINQQRDAPSAIAKLVGIEGHKIREGVVHRPLIELTKNNGERVIVKHKRDEFMETRTPREVDPTRVAVLDEAQAIAQEWVTDMRLTHVLDKLPEAKSMQQTSLVVKAMIDDVKREAGQEVVWSKEAERAIGSATAALFKQRVPASIPPVCDQAGVVSE